MAILWSSCPHLYSTNGESHVTISDAAIKVAQTTMNLVLLLVLYPGYDTCGKVRNFWINPYAHSRLSLVVAIKYIRAIFRFLTLLTVDMITCTIGDKFHRWTDLTDGWSGLWIEFQNNQHDLDTVVKNISHNWTEYENILKSSCFHMPSLVK